MVAAQVLNREVFRTSRELEYFTVKELTLQTGHEPQRWAEVVVKELVDNSLDACEAAGILPDITITIESDSITVADNGAGIPADVVKSVLDFSIRVSSKDAYIAPTRGAQGNALKTVVAIPYVLNYCRSGRVRITGCGQQHIISVSVDRIAQRPTLDCQSTASVVKNESSFTVWWPNSASLQDEDKSGRFLQLLDSYSLFNPHATFTFNCGEVEEIRTRTSETCGKWLASEPTSPHWYTQDQLRALVAAYITSERHGSQARTVREFVSEFRGLSGTAKQKAILGRVGLAGVYLHDLVKDGDIDRNTINGLLEAMKAESKPVKPVLLGVIGETHLKNWFEAQGVELKTFEYKRVVGVDDNTGRPFVIEIAFAARLDDDQQRRLITGINWSPTLVDPFRQFQGYGLGLSALLSQLKVEPKHDVTFVLHLACPHLNYTDRGKSSLEVL
jgi:DNA topoisomerase VI subunit B